MNFIVELFCTLGIYWRPYHDHRHDHHRRRHHHHHYHHHRHLYHFIIIIINIIIINDTATQSLIKFFQHLGNMLLIKSLNVNDANYILVRPSPANQGNFDHGAYKSGDKLEAKKDSFEQFLSAQSCDYFESFQEAVAADRGEPFSGHCDFDSVSDVMSDWMNSKALRNRGLYVTLLNDVQTKVSIS